LGNEVLGDDGRWSFCLYLDHATVTDDLIPFAAQVLELATSLPSGEEAWRKWPDAIDMVKVAGLQKQAQRLRAGFDYESLF